ncbi:hypothetical protein B0H14DRAFT_3683866 [Mycena olivaceomarginata]|nr:hypothetical protein B0H14DRAFT_3683866 [Mycena olivaceomarginata]
MSFNFFSENDKFGDPSHTTLGAAGPAPPPPTDNYRRSFRWAGQYAPPDENPALNARSTASQVPISHLKISPKQRKRIEEMYHPVTTASFATPPLIDCIYTLDDTSQLEAAGVMAQYHLDPESQEDLGNRWSQQWSFRSKNVKEETETRRILYLCKCGYDHHQRTTKYDRLEQDEPGSQQRHTPVPFTGCLAHAELTVRANKILRIRGHFEHNEECKTANLTSFPPIPVHPSVYVIALAQLRDGATFSDIRQKNRDLFDTKAYAGFPPDLESSPHRWLLTSNDSRSLYRQYNRMKGVSVTTAPEINVDDWLDPKSDKFNPTLAHVVFHYSPRANRGERFEVAIANDDMDRAAWTYGHQSQIILDGTFGKGVPVAFLLFSAPTGNRQSSSGYDTAILTKLLKKWSESLNKRVDVCGHPGVAFKPMSAITDTDLKEPRSVNRHLERYLAADLSFSPPAIVRNHRNKLLKGKSAVYQDLKNRMVCLERALTATQTIEEARALLETERQVMHELSMEEQKQPKKRSHILIILTPTGLRTIFGQGVIPTTNHLEAFNGVLKGTHLRRWGKDGRRIRVDVLIHALAVYILPSIFKERRMISEQASRIAALLVPAVPKVAYLVPDEKRDARAQELLSHRQISAPTVLSGNVGLTLTSYSSRALSFETTPTTYTIRLGFSGVVCCDCQDFKHHGGACKHIRGALIIVDDMRRRGTPIPDIPIPRSLADAQSLQSTMLTIKIRPNAPDLPTAKAAEKIRDILQEDGACHEDSGERGDEEDGGEEDEDDSVSVRTDAESSDSDSEDDQSQRTETFRATQNKAALGEQAVSRAVFDLEDMASRLADLGTYLDHRVVGLNPEESAKVDKGYGQLIDFISKLQRVRELPPSIHPRPASLPLSVDSPSASATTAPIARPNKRKLLLPPSPEKMQKRHQSFGVH